MGGARSRGGGGSGGMVGGGGGMVGGGGAGGGGGGGGMVGGAPDGVQYDMPPLPMKANVLEKRKQQAAAQKDAAFPQHPNAGGAYENPA